jgi:membrane associated rhomboid family serine protease
MTSTGFTDAPVTRALLVSSCLLTISASLSQTREQSFSLSPETVFGRREFWRLMTSQLVFPAPSDLIAPIILLYQFRFFERTYGTRKFLAAVLFHISGAILLQLLFYSFCGPFSSGLNPLIFALVVQYWLDVPKGAVSVFGVLSEKSGLYFLALQCFHTRPSCASALLGVLLGLLYRRPELPFQRLRVPESLLQLLRLTSITGPRIGATVGCE